MLRPSRPRPRHTVETGPRCLSRRLQHLRRRQAVTRQAVALQAMARQARPVRQVRPASLLFQRPLERQPRLQAPAVQWRRLRAEGKALAMAMEATVQLRRLRVGGKAIALAMAMGATAGRSSRTLLERRVPVDTTFTITFGECTRSVL